MNCPFCYSKIDDDAAFCGSCGRRIERTRSAEEIVVTIGRATDNNLVLSESSVSSHHAVLKMYPDRIVLEDLNSTNGTYVNGRKVMIASVSRSDQISFGKTALLSWSEVDRAMGRQGSQPEEQKSPPYTPPPVAYPPAIARPRLPLPVPKKQEAREVGDDEDAPPHKARNPIPAVIPQQSVHAGLGGELAYAMHMNKSYVGPAFLTFLLYYIGFWIGGIIANVIYMNAAKRTKEITRQSPPGYGCLIFLFFSHFVLPLILLFIVMIFGISILGKLF